MLIPPTHTQMSTQVRDRLPHLKVIIQYSPEPVDPAQRDQGVIPWEEFMEIGKVFVQGLQYLLTLGFV